MAGAELVRDRGGEPGEGPVRDAAWFDQSGRRGRARVSRMQDRRNLQITGRSAGLPSGSSGLPPPPDTGDSRWLPRG